MNLLRISGWSILDGSASAFMALLIVAVFEALIVLIWWPSFSVPNELVWFVMFITFIKGLRLRAED